jgi:hypothetical protein
MKDKFPYLVYSLAIVLLLVIAGCVAPPAENATSAVDLKNPKQSAKNTSDDSPSFVSMVTPSDLGSTTTISPAGYTTFIATTQIPEDITCRIHGIDVSGYNSTAFTFDLKNAPMYINYSAVPKNVTVNRVYTDTNTKKTVTLKSSEYSLTSWFEVTVRDNNTKEIVFQDGFGESKGYPTYLNRTLKIMKSGNLLVEFRGNDMKKASATVWVKPIGNFDESRFSEFTNCMYWDAHRDSLPTAKQTTIKGVIYTWTPEGKYTSKAPTMVKQGTPIPRNESNYQWG